jgi:type VI protein secretion system component Hcp
VIAPQSGSRPVKVAIDSFQFGFHDPVTFGSGHAGIGPVGFDELTVQVAFNASSPELFGWLAGGADLKAGPIGADVAIENIDSRGELVASWTLGNTHPAGSTANAPVYIASDAYTGGPGSLPGEELKFVFGSLTQATASSSGAPQRATWNVVLNTPDGPPPIAPLNKARYAPYSKAFTGASLTKPGYLLELDNPSNTSLPAQLIVELSSYQFGFHDPVTHTTGQTTAGGTTFDDLVVTKRLDDDSTGVLSLLFTGGHYQKAVLRDNVTSGGVGGPGTTVAEWVLSTVYVTSDAISVAAGDDGHPVEDLHFTFAAATEATASQSASWNGAQQSAQRVPAVPTGLGALSTPAAPTVTLQLNPADGSAPVTVALRDYQFGAVSHFNPAGAFKPPSFDELVADLGFAPDSPQLLKSLFNGRSYSSAVLIQDNAAGQPAAAWVLRNVFVTSDATGADLTNPLSAPPNEAIHLAFDAITEAVGGPSGAATASWDLVTATASGPPLPHGLVLSPLVLTPALSVGGRPRAQLLPVQLPRPGHPHDGPDHRRGHHVRRPGRHEAFGRRLHGGAEPPVHGRSLPSTTGLRIFIEIPVPECPRRAYLEVAAVRRDG